MALTAVGLCFAAAAYAATRYARLDQGRTVHRPLRPQLLATPSPVTAERIAEFAFFQPSRPRARAHRGYPLGFECRLDGEEWGSCRSPFVLRSLDPGSHRFDVRAVAFRLSGPYASYAWRVTRRSASGEDEREAQREREREREAARAPKAPVPVPPPSAPGSTSAVAPPVVVPVGPEEAEEEESPAEGDELAIGVDTSNLEPLLPGAPAQPLPVVIANPNSETVFVTSLSVRASTEVEGCDGATNFELTPAGVSPTLSLEVPAGGTASLPAPGIAAPQIAMRDLPYSQDACQGADVELDLEAEAHG